MTTPRADSARLLRGTARVTFAFALTNLLATVTALARLPYALPSGQALVVVVAMAASTTAFLFGIATVLEKPAARRLGLAAVICASLDAVLYGLLWVAVREWVWFFPAWSAAVAAYAAFAFHRLAGWPSGAQADEQKSTLSIFISYRRRDSRDTVGRIHDHLRRAFDERRIFLDVERQVGGEDYRVVIDRALARADVVLAVIGPDWLVAAGRDGGHRIDHPEDMVRLELEAALTRKLRVVPVLIEGAVMPRADELPDSLRDLSYRSALAVRPDPDFKTDMPRLIVTLRLPPEFQSDDIGVVAAKSA
jgi:TIR domain-containing protein